MMENYYSSLFNMKPNFRQYTQSECTLRVGSPSSSYMDFKCNKFVLSRASEFFERTFFGNFKESRMGPDEPILLDNIEPPVFEFALRHMYGQPSNLQNERVLLKTKVYRMADEMLITSLVRELDRSFQGTKAPEIFSVFDLYLFLGNKLGIYSSKKILAEVTAEDFSSEDWHRMSQEGVEEFLKMEWLDVEEVDLARALISWGMFNVQLEGGDPKDTERLRSKIQFGFKWIRFAVMKQDDFAQLCREQFGAVLRDEEKNSILVDIAYCKQMPFPLVENRKKTPIEFNLPCMQYFSPNARQDLFTANLIFHLDQKAEFLGPRVGPSTAAYGLCILEVYDTDNYKFIATGFSNEKKIAYWGEEYCQFTPKCILSAGTKYNLSFTFPCAYAFLQAKHAKDPIYPYFTLPQNRFTLNGLTLTVDSTLVHVFFKSMLFVKCS